MRDGRCSRCGRGRSSLRLLLLVPPALFWAAVFAALAGARPLGAVLERGPDVAQLLVAAACTLLAVALGLEAQRGGRRAGETPAAVAYGRGNKVCTRT